MTQGKAIVAGIEDGFDANGDGDVKGVTNTNPVEAGRGDAHDLKGIAIQSEALADNGRIAGEIALPKSVADVGGAEGTARLIVFRAKQAAKCRLNAEDTEEITADAKAIGEANFATSRQIVLVIAPDSHFREGFLALADFFPHGEGQLRILAGKLAGAPVAVGDADGA